MARDATHPDLGPPPVLPYADTTTPAGIDGVQVIVVHPDVRRIAVSPPRHPERAYRPVAFEVTPCAFRTAQTGPFGVARGTWPRSALLDVRLNRTANRLVLRLAGQDPLELDLGHDPAVTELVMHELINATNVIPPAPPNLQVARGSDAGGLPPSTARTALFAAGGVVLAAAVACLWVVPIASLYLFLLVPVPIGIAVGTRRQDM